MARWEAIARRSRCWKRENRLPLPQSSRPAARGGPSRNGARYGAPGLEPSRRARDRRQCPSPAHAAQAQEGTTAASLLWNAREIPVAWELDADVVCSFWTTLFPLVARMRGMPAVVAFNVQLCTTYLRASTPRRRLMGAALRSAQAVVCFASAQRERLLRQHDLDPDRVHTVPFGVDERFYRPRPRPRGRLRAGRGP